MGVARERLAAQLYTVRDFMTTEADLAETLAKIAAIGYAGVQLSAVKAMSGDFPSVSPETARKMLDDNGLVCAATHRSWDSLKQQTDEEIAFHKTLGCSFTAIGSLPAEYQKEGEDGYRRFIADAAPVIAQLKSEDIQFGYHNHDGEFARIERGAAHNPKTLFDLFIEEGGPDFCLELDLYWIWHAGADPNAILRRCQGRLPLIHIKDREVVAGQGPIMAAIGEGNLPWETILPVIDETGVHWIAVEQDVCPRDPFDCLSSSWKYLANG